MHQLFDYQSAILARQRFTYSSTHRELEPFAFSLKEKLQTPLQMIVKLEYSSRSKPGLVMCNRKCLWAVGRLDPRLVSLVNVGDPQE